MAQQSALKLEFGSGDVVVLYTDSVTERKYPTGPFWL